MYKSLSSQRFHAYKRSKIFALRASVLGLIPSMRLNGRKDVQPVKSVRSVLHAELKSSEYNLYTGLWQLKLGEISKFSNI